MPKKEEKTENVQSEFSNFVPSIFSFPTLDTLLKDADKKEVILADVKIHKTSFGDIAVILLGSGKQFHTSSKVMLDKFAIAKDNGITYPIKAIILRKGEEPNEYYDLV